MKAGSFSRVYVQLTFQEGASESELSPALDEGQVVYLFSDAGVLHPRYCRVIWVRAGRPEQQCEAGLEFPQRLVA
jgi:hypothetical protein